MGIKIFTKEPPKTTLLQRWLKYKDKGYKKSECSMLLVNQKELEEGIEYLKHNSIEHEVNSNILTIKWKK